MSKITLNASNIAEAFKRQGVTHVVGLPDNGSCALWELIGRDPDLDLISVTREGEAFAVACGLFIGGKNPVVIIQNTGFLESGDAIRGTAHNMGIPLVILIGYRGFESMSSGRGMVDTAATFFEPTLNAWQIPYSLLTTDQEVGLIAQAFDKAKAINMPVAVIYPGETV